MTLTIDSTASTQVPGRSTARSLGYKRVTWERIMLAVAHYVEKRPLKTFKTPIEAPTVEELAIAYDVSVADIQRKLDEL